MISSGMKGEFSADIIILISVFIIIIIIESTFEYIHLWNHHHLPSSLKAHLNIFIYEIQRVMFWRRPFSRPEMEFLPLVRHHWPLNHYRHHHHLTVVIVIITIIIIISKWLSPWIIIVVIIASMFHHHHHHFKMADPWITMMMMMMMMISRPLLVHPCIHAPNRQQDAQNRVKHLRTNMALPSDPC